MPKVTIEVELTEERVQRVLEMFEEMDKTLAEMRQISQELKSVTETLSDESLSKFYVRDRLTFGQKRRVTGGFAI